MTLGIVVPIWGRPALARECLAALPDWARAYPVLSPEDPDRAGALPQHITHFCAAPNRPLTGKYVAGIDAALADGCNAVMLWGSDDFAEEHTFRLLHAEALRAGHAGSDWLLIHDGLSGRTRVWHGPNDLAREPCGPGRTIRADVLRDLGGGGYLWRLFDGGLDRGIDGPAHQAMVRAGYPCSLVAAPILDVKLAGNLTPFEAAADLPKTQLGYAYPRLAAVMRARGRRAGVRPWA